MSLTSTVPASVPSLFQSSDPFVASLAVKNSVPFTFVRYVGDTNSSAAGQMSLTSTVPARVPSLFQSSYPCVASVACEEQRAVHVRERLTGDELLAARARCP